MDGSNMLGMIHRERFHQQAETATLIAKKFMRKVGSH